MLSRLKEVLHYLRNLRIDDGELLVRANGRGGEWRGRITLQADANEVSESVKNRVNALETPFELRLQRHSGKLWDWKLVGVTNAGLELAAPATNAPLYLPSEVRSSVRAESTSRGAA